MSFKLCDLETLLLPMLPLLPQVYFYISGWDMDTNPNGYCNSLFSLYQIPNVYNSMCGMCHDSCLSKT